MEPPRKPQRIVLAILLAAIGCVLMIGSSSYPDVGRNETVPRSRQARQIGLFTRALKFVMLLLASWCVMTFVHESGHILCGWACGGTLKTADLCPGICPTASSIPTPGRSSRFGADRCLARQFPWPSRSSCGGTGCGLSPISASWPMASIWRRLGSPALPTWTLRNSLSTVQPAAIAVYCLVTIGFGYVGFRRQWIRALAGFSTAHP